jgi:hypothetical protein|tara:strand:+ start:176 stop:373 length:198 start_codon:yes stop_codon:yes gene_type:complete
MVENPNSVTGQNRVIRKKGDLTGCGKGDWLRIDLQDEQYKKNYDKIFGKKNILVDNKMISDEADK